MSVRRKPEYKFEIRLGNITRRLFGPLDETHRIRPKVLAEPRILKLFCFIEPIKIKVIQVYARNYVNFNQRISRAFHRPGMSQRSQQGTNQGRLPRAEVAIKPDHHAGSQQRRQLPPKRNRCRLIR